MAALGVDQTQWLGETPPGAVPVVASAPDPDRATRRRLRIIKTLALLIAMAIIALVVIATMSRDVSPSYRVAHGTVWLAAPNGQEVPVVTIVIKNTGRTTSSPTCVVRTTYFDIGLQGSTFSLKPPIKPGGVRFYISPLPSPPTSVSLVKKSDVTVTCH